MENHAELRKPLDPRDFTAELKAEMRAELDALDTALPKLDWVAISERKSGAIKLTKIGPADLPQEGHQTPPNWLNNKLSGKAPRPDNLWRNERSFDMVATFLPDSKGNHHGPCSYVDPLLLLV
ncbi:hypothetical protein [Nonomuraea fuscirosea]|uniref:hypothetical protein n=1 Tax=Nonomuraea fuscirosea TaxID=1291556 RepID=UPI0011B24A93|nr:hypothetical protein [Nonomuraea fuscirosea]